MLPFKVNIQTPLPGKVTPPLAANPSQPFIVSTAVAESNDSEPGPQVVAS